MILKWFYFQAKIKEEEEKRIAAEEAEKKAKIEKRKEEKRLAKQVKLKLMMLLWQFPIVKPHFPRWCICHTMSKKLRSTSEELVSGEPSWVVTAVQ